MSGFIRDENPWIMAGNIFAWSLVGLAATILLIVLPLLTVVLPILEGVEPNWGLGLMGWGMVGFIGLLVLWFKKATKWDDEHR